MVRSLPVLVVVGTWLLTSVTPAPVAAEPFSGESEIWHRAVAQADSPEADEDGPRADRARDEASEVEVPRVGPQRVTAFGEMIENIVITSRKRREALQSVPISVTAFSADSLKQLQVRSIQDISATVPNLDYEETFGFGNSARVNIRGVGQSDPIGTVDPGVGLYVDGVYLPRLQSGLLNTSDIERVEVVRGPQGTIFGKNTIGGAVNVISQRPQFELGGFAEVRLGNFDLFETRAALNVPLIEEMAALRVSLATATRDGFSKDRLGGTDPADDKLLAGRAQLLLLPTENLEILLSGDYSRENRVQEQGKCQVQNPGANAQLQFLNALVGTTQVCADIQASDNPRRVESDLSFFRDDLKSYGGSAQITWSLGTNTELRSLSAVRGLDNTSLGDFDATRIELIRPAIDAGGFEQTQISQELQLSTKMMDDRLSVLVGAFGLKEQSKDTVFEGVLANLMADDIQDVVPGFGPVDQPTKVLLANLARGAAVRSFNRVDNLTYAAYAQVSYDITDALNFTAGLRFSQDRRRVFREGVALTTGQGITAALDGTLPTPLQAGDTAFFFERSDRFSDFTPSASLSYEFSPDVLAYASYSTGFKSGGFNGRAFPPLGATEADFPVSYDPEDLTTYEVGFKAAFADRKVAINASAFYSIYEDIQLVVLPGDPTINSIPVQLLNAGESIITGGELELVLSPIPNLQLRTSLGLLNDRFTEFDDPSDPRAKDRRLPFQSRYETSTSVEYSFDLAQIGMLVARADWTTRSKRFLDPANSDSLEAGKRGILDARIALNMMDGVTEIAVFGKNLTDREYLVSGVDFSNTFGIASRIFGPPRTYGIELRRRF